MARPRKPFEDLTGRKFGMLTVLGFEERKHRMRKWRCRCDCGKETVVYEVTLRKDDDLHSCGCERIKYLKPGDAERCAKAGRKRAEARNKDGVNVDMLDNSKNISTNTSGHKGISWSANTRKWHVYIGYKSFRCTLAYLEDFDTAVKLREAAYDAIMNGTFEDFFYNLRGFRIEERISKQQKKKKPDLVDE